MASMVIENGDVIDGMGNEPQRGMDVVIDGNRRQGATDESVSPAPTLRRWG